MCGIAGGAWTGDPGPGPVAAALALLHRRGPDHVAAQSWATGRQTVRIGATRLAVQDLSARSDQPMTTPDGRFTIAYNGEITNFVEIREHLQGTGVEFRSAGDTEVLLEAWRAWGPACLDRLDGMYAFAMLDREQRRVTLARDPFGIKPLFVASDPGGHGGGASIVFASEMASVLALRGSTPRLDDQAAVDYLVTGRYDRSERTFVEGVQHLLPGTCLTVSLDESDLHLQHAPRTWVPAIDPVRFGSGDGGSAEVSSVHAPADIDDAADRVRELFLASVRRNLRSDVPVGLALSGGIDSSAIVAAVRALEPQREIRTFSFVAPGSRGDETPWIDVMNVATGAQATMVVAQAEEMLADLDDLVLAQGEPFGSLSIYAQYRVFQAMHEAGIVVSLDGQGADELLAGYRGYPAARIASLLGTGQPVSALAHGRRWSQLPGASAMAATGHVASAMGLSGPVQRLRRRLRSERTPMRADVLAARGVSPQYHLPSGELPGPTRGRRLMAALRADLLDGDLAALLRHGDRNSMRFSVEGRVPFLDRALIEFCLALPEEYLVDRAATTKAVFRRAMRGLVPDRILDRRDKIGFEAPAGQWLGGHLDQLAELVLDGPPIAILDLPAAGAAIAGGRLAPATVWRVVNLSRWVALLGVDAT